MSNATLTRPDLPRPPASRRPTAIIAAAVLASAGALLFGLFAGRDTSTHRYTYTGTVVAVCAHRRGSSPGCFAITPDPGTAHRDGYYAGRGDVSFGVPPMVDVVPQVGDHVSVTVVSVVDEGSTIEQVSLAPDS